MRLPYVEFPRSGHSLGRRQFGLSLAAALCYAAVLRPRVAFAQATDEQVWQQFLTWLPSVPASDNPGPIVAQYRAHLAQAGASPSEVDRQLGVVFQMMRTRVDGWRVMFNNIYTATTPGFNTQPNSLLVSAVEGRKPGRALDVGMGQGRNAVFLAIKGWDVTGFDISDEGLNVARKSADRAGVKVSSLLQSDDQFDFGIERWDLIVITYEPVPVTTANYVNKLRAALRPGGLIVIESFASSASDKVRRPVDIDPAALRSAFDSFQVLRFEDTFAMPDWGKTDTRLARLVAQKRT